MSKIQERLIENTNCEIKAVVIYPEQVQRPGLAYVEGQKESDDLKELSDICYKINNFLCDHEIPVQNVVSIHSLYAGVGDTVVFYKSPIVPEEEDVKPKTKKKE